MENKVVPEDILKDTVFSKIEVHPDENRRQIRSYNLRKALKLGNLYKRKVTIHYRTLQGVVYKIETSVWAVGEQFISLKKGNTIPIHAIDHVEF
jgi:hypothetical protein